MYRCPASRGSHSTVPSNIVPRYCTVHGRGGVGDVGAFAAPVCRYCLYVPLRGGLLRIEMLLSDPTRDKPDPCFAYCCWLWSRLPPSRLERSTVPYTLCRSLGAESPAECLVDSETSFFSLVFSFYKTLRSTSYGWRSWPTFWIHVCSTVSVFCSAAAKGPPIISHRSAQAMVESGLGRSGSDENLGLTLLSWHPLYRKDLAILSFGTNSYATAHTFCFSRRRHAAKQLTHTAHSHISLTHKAHSPEPPLSPVLSLSLPPRPRL